MIGRRTELTALASLLADGARLVTVLGPAGVGKTRLALEVAADARDAFEGGAFVVPLADVRDPNLVGSAIVSALGATDLGAGDPVLVVAKLVTGRRTLLVLDNLEHLLPASATVAALLAACDELSILVTSRHPLDLSSESCYPLAPLELPPLVPAEDAEILAAEAVRLLLLRLRAVDPVTAWERQADALARICRRLDGLPLALELVAPRARALSLEAVLAALERRVPLLSTGGVDRPERQRTMAAALAWSCDLLPPTTLRVFRRLGLCLGGVSLDSLATMTADLGLSELELLDLVDDLVSHHLVARTHDGRLSMLEVVREYAEAALRATDDREAAEMLHDRCFLELAEACAGRLAGPDQVATLERMQADRANFSSAVRRALDRADAERALRLCIALRLLWYVRGPLVEGQAFFAAALALPAVDGRTRARAFVEAAALARHSGHLTGAAGLAQEGLAIARREGDPALLATALLQHGFVSHLRGSFTDAQASLDECLVIRRRSGDELGQARVLHHLGLVAWFRDGDTASAWDLLARCHASFRRLGSKRDVATVLIAMSEVARARTELQVARELLDEALVLVQELDDGPLLAYALYGAASLVADEDRPSQACRVLGAAEGVQERCGSPVWPAVARSVDRWLPGVTARLGTKRVASLRAAGASSNAREAAALAAVADRGNDPLSAREQEIAELVAAGLSNRAIAESLVISPRTVDGHVANIMTKLGVRARAQIATWLAQSRD